MTADGRERVAVADTGVGNAAALLSALLRLGCRPRLAKRPRDLDGASHILLPGVGSLATARQELAHSGLDSALISAAQAGTPLLGICLGFHLLARHGAEGGEVQGLGLLPGEVRPLDELPGVGQVPNIGWSPLTISEAATPWLRPQETESFYFAHSYRFLADEPDCIGARVRCGAADFVALACSGSVLGVQFHPELSGPAGAVFLERFLGRQITAAPRSRHCDSLLSAVT